MSMLLAHATRLVHLTRLFGPRWVAGRATYVLLLRSGLPRLTLPMSSWTDHPLARLLSTRSLADPAAYLAYRRTAAPRFFFACADRPRFTPHFATWDAVGEPPQVEADALAAGQLRYFTYLRANTGCPPAWHKNPFSGETSPPNRHWSEIDEFAAGDIKYIWEPSRFAFTYPLVRAYWRTGDERYAALFWQLVEDWRDHNPPQQGPNWRCGQEIAFRVMAWCFGLYGFLVSSETTPDRAATLAQMIAISGRRIAANIGYAISQRNNHSISEATGLWTIGLLFPELRHAARWRELGRRILERDARELIYDDGGFSQASANYHRVMLHDYLWAIRLGDLLGYPLSDSLRRRVARAGAFLYQLQETSTGRCPSYGPNDSTIVLPLNNCSSEDLRPIVQTIHYLASTSRCFPDGPWDEDLLWLFGPEALTSRVDPPQQADLHAPIAGCYTLRASNSFAFARCQRYRHRPTHPDALHVTLWWRGQQVALDISTYSYNAPAPWHHAFPSTVYHNTVTVDGRDQMDRAGRFLWLPWLRATVRAHCRSQAGRLAYWEGIHDGYARLTPPATHRRAIVQLDDERWLVLDDLYSTGRHHYRLHWLLLDYPYTWDTASGRLTLETTAGTYTVQCGTLEPQGHFSLVRADPASPRGWHAPSYGRQAPALSLALEVCRETTRFWTLFSPVPCKVYIEPTMLNITAPDWYAQLRLNHDARQPLVSTVSLQGSITDKLTIL